MSPLSEELVYRVGSVCHYLVISAPVRAPSPTWCSFVRWYHVTQRDLGPFGGWTRTNSERSAKAPVNGQGAQHEAMPFSESTRANWAPVSAAYDRSNSTNSSMPEAMILTDRSGSLFKKLHISSRTRNLGIDEVGLLSW